jgi:hypothetical protein
MIPGFESVRADLAAFADDDADVIVDRRGECLFVRAGREITFKLSSDAEDRLIAEYNGERMLYRRFLSHHLAQLPVLAERILAKRPPVPAYVDGQALLEGPSIEQASGRALPHLLRECTEHPAFSARVSFITADAGQGKTALLRQFQHDQAARFLAGQSGFVFWHVDLQGRQLLRLSEALMGDLGDLRVSGLWMAAIIRLLRHRVLVLAIDGFDELAAEQGGRDALGALALLVQQIGSEGTIVAASRRTFFDTDDYIRRAHLFSRTGGEDCEFDQISLVAWEAADTTAYLAEVEVDGRRFDDPASVYEEIVAELGQAQHPMLTRPFLVAQIARALLRFRLRPADFIRGMEDPLKGVGAVIEAFVDREVTEKWKQKETGEPFLTKEQHLRLLSDVAEEMFRSQRAHIDIDVLETIATLLLEEWGTDTGRRQQILEMVRMHVLLPPPAEGGHSARTFDHEEFRDWFTAYALKDRLLRLREGGGSVSHDLLSVAHLPDATARYVCALIDRTPEQVENVVAGLVSLVETEWRPTYLQPNVGTIIPFLLDGVVTPQRLVVKGAMVYSSLVFEGGTLRNVCIEGGTFLNASFTDVNWRDVEFVDCDLGEVTFDKRSTYDSVVLRDCRLEGLRLIDGDEQRREYAPERIQLILRGLGIEIAEAVEASPRTGSALPDGPTRKLVRRVLKLFRRTTFLPQTVVEQRFHSEASRVMEEILPMMEQFGVVEPRSWRGSGRQLAWGLPRSLEDIERADGDASHPLHAFWEHVDELDHRASAR